MTDQPTEVRDVAPNEAESAYQELHEGIVQARKELTDTFWDIGAALSRMQRACIGCLYLPSIDEIPEYSKGASSKGRGKRIPCPRCRAPLGLYQVKFPSFSDYLRHPKVAMPKATAYKWIQIYDMFAPYLDEMGQLMAPQEDQENQRSLARELIVSVGWTKLESVRAHISRAANAEEVLHILQTARDNPRAFTRKANTTHMSKQTMALYNEMKTLRDHYSSARYYLQQGQYDKALMEVEALNSKSRQMRLQLQSTLEDLGETAELADAEREA